MPGREPPIPPEKDGIMPGIPPFPLFSEHYSPFCKKQGPGAGVRDRNVGNVSSVQGRESEKGARKRGILRLLSARDGGNVRKVCFLSFLPFLLFLHVSHLSAQTRL